MNTPSTKDSTAVWRLFVPLNANNPTHGQEFELRIQPDGACLCIDHTAARIQLGDYVPTAPAKALADRVLFEFSVECQVPRSIYRRIKVINHLGDDQDLDDVAALDKVLLSIFWSDINPKLNPPRRVL